MTKLERRTHWETQVTAFRASGQSVSEWCSNHQVKTHRLWYWIRQLQPTSEATSTPTSKWVPVELGDSVDPSSNHLSIRIGDAVIEVKSGFDPVLLADVVRSLRTVC
jgi:hypothetical protein